MTVSASYTPLSFSGNSSTTAFAVTWPFFSGTLLVTEIASTGVETVKTITTHYTVSGGTDSNGLAATGTVTMLTAPATGTTLRIERVTPKTQSSTWAESDAFPQKVVEAAFDRLTLISQEAASGGADGITGDVMQLNSAGAQDYWDAESQPISGNLPFVELAEASAPSTPSSGYGRLYAKTDGLYYKDDAGTEVSVSGQAAAAAVSATAAASSATNAATSATNASTSATNAATSATTASTQATNAATSATTASTQATNAATSATAAAAAAGFTWAYSTTTTMADPGAGTLRLNNATVQSATAIVVDDVSADSGAPDVSLHVLTWGASTNTTTKGTLRLRKKSAPQQFVDFAVTGVTDNAGWAELAVTHEAGTPTWSNADELIVSFFRAGNKGVDGAGAGDVVGPASAVTARIATFNGTTGKLIQDGGKTIAEVGDVFGQASSVDNEIALFSGTGGKTIKRASTTGLLKASSGVIAAAVAGTDYAAATSGSAILKGNGAGGTASAVAGTDYAAATTGSSVLKGDGAGGTTAAASTDLGAGLHTVWIPAAAMTARTTNGAASGTTELATNDVMLSTLDFDTTTEEGAGFMLAMPKSWNEGTVTFIPYWTAASGSGGVVWGLAGYAFSNDDAMDAAVSGQQTSTDTLLTANDCHIGPTSSAITIGGTPAAEDLVYFEVTREVANGSDTIAADCKLIGIKLMITTDAITDA